MRIVSNDTKIIAISTTKMPDLNNNKTKDIKVSIIPETTKSLPTYLFDLYQISSFESVIKARGSAF